jgi:hypothetical protein
MTGGAKRGPKLHLRRTASVERTRKGRWLGWTGGLFSRLFGRRIPPVTGEDLRQHDYPVSTQRMGVRFTERMRDTFRFRWLRKSAGGKNKERRE